MKRTVRAALLVSFALYAAEPPAVKEGLWSVHTVMIDNPGNKRTEGTRSLCRTHAYDVRAREQAQTKQKQICKTVARTSSGNTFTEESECTIQGSVATIKVVTSFASDTSIHSETHDTYKPPLGGVAEMSVILDQKYLGACPAGMEPGDFMSSDGKVTHVKQP
jgi:hypothetical protein